MRRPSANPGENQWLGQGQKELKDIRNELGEETGGFGELFRPGIRLALVIGIVLMVFSQHQTASTRSS